MEIDHPATQERKAGIARRTLPEELWRNTAWLGHDLGLAPEALAGGADVRTFWIAEGVFGYLPRESVQRLLVWMVSKSARGSRVVFTYVERDFRENSILRYLEEAGEPFLSSWTPQEMAVDCRDAGLRIDEDVSEAELHARYLAPLGRTLSAVKEFRIVSAVVER